MKPPSLFIDFDSRFSPICVSLRQNKSYQILTPIQKLCYIELLGRYVELGYPCDWFTCPYGWLKDTSITKVSWLSSIKALESHGFIKVQRFKNEVKKGHFKNNYKLSNQWKDKYDDKTNGARK